MPGLDLAYLQSLCRDETAFKELKEIFEEQHGDYKRQIKELQEKEHYLRLVLDLDPSFIFVRDKKGRFQLANQSLADSFGLPVDEIIGKTDADIIDDQEEVNLIREMDLKVLESEKVHIMPERRIVDADGKERWLRVIKCALPNKTNGNREQIIAVTVDITQEKIASLQYKHLKNRYEALVLSQTDFIWVFTPDSLVVEPSDSWMRYTGQSAEEMLHDGWLKAIHIEDRPRFQRRLMQAFETINTFQIQCRIQDATYQYNYYDVWVAPVLDQDKNVLEWIGGCTQADLF